MVFIVPISLLTTTPGIIFTLSKGLWFLTVLSVFSISLIGYLALGKGLSIQTRKFLLLGITFISALILLTYMGFKGPGFLYLYSACVFGILILPTRYAYVWSWSNLAISIIFALVVHFDWSPLTEVNEMSAGEWTGISAHLLFLSFLTSALLPQLFNGLSNSFERQQKLQEALSHEKETLRKTLEELEQKNEDLEQFAYSASHDLQEPLRMVRSFMGQLERKYQSQLDEKAQQYIHFAVDGASRMSTIIQDLLKYSRIGRSADPPEYLALSEIVEEVMHLEEGRVSTSQASIHFDNLPSVKSLRAPLLQILQNLISNSLKYHREDVPPVVTITAKERPQEWQIAVADNGIGIAPEYHNKIFLIFQRFAHLDNKEGTGIGLALVKKNVEFLGGRVWVRSESEKGSTFYFTIPKL